MCGVSAFVMANGVWRGVLLVADDSGDDVAVSVDDDDDLLVTIRLVGCVMVIWYQSGMCGNLLSLVMASHVFIASGSNQ